MNTVLNHAAKNSVFFIYLTVLRGVLADKCFSGLLYHYIQDIDSCLTVYESGLAVRVRVRVRVRIGIRVSIINSETRICNHYTYCTGFTTFREHFL
jgi:hypothetical protein